MLLWHNALNSSEEISVNCFMQMATATSQCQDCHLTGCSGVFLMWAQDSWG